MTNMKISDTPDITVLAHLTLRNFELGIFAGASRKLSHNSGFKYYSESCKIKKMSIFLTSKHNFNYESNFDLISSIKLNIIIYKHQGKDMNFKISDNNLIKTILPCLKVQNWIYNLAEWDFIWKIYYILNLITTVHRRISCKVTYLSMLYFMI